MQTPTHFFAASELIVVGNDSEMADYDNPTGAIIRSAAYVYAEDAKGYRTRLWVATGWEQEVMLKAEALARALNNRLNNLGKLPVAFETWDHARPCYGSDAYVESGQGEEDAFMDRFED